MEERSISSNKTHSLRHFLLFSFPFNKKKHDPRASIPTPHLHTKPHNGIKEKNNIFPHSNLQCSPPSLTINSFSFALVSQTKHCILSEEKMSSRKQRCNGCGVKLMVPPEAKTMRCASCQAVTRIQPLDPLDRTQDLFRKGDRWVKGFISTVSNKIDSFASSMNNSHSGSSYYSGTTTPSYSYGYPPPPASATPSNGYGYPPPPVSTTPSYSYGYPPPPVAASRPHSYPTVHGKKRALLCGIRYRARKYELKGSINDVNCMKYFLVEKCGFPKESMLVLSEDERDPCLIPTRQNLKMAMQWLVQGCKSGDSLVFHYSGHGSRKANYTLDEVDGYDETLCPLDFETQGMILDNEINATIVRPLPKGVILHAIIDSCHSGTVLDMPFLCRMNQNGYYVWEDHSPPSGAYKGTNGGLALSYSACDDHQTSADTSVFSGNAMTGAMTYSFIHAAQSAPAGLTYGALLNAMRLAIRDANKGMQSSSSGPIASFLRKILFTGLSQEPQLSASETFDIYATKFVL